MKEKNSDTARVKKVPDCKYAQPNYFWEDAERPGWIGSPEKKKITDLRGHWKLTNVRCTRIFASEDESWKKLGCFHWCHEPERCDGREPGNPRPPVFSWVEGSGENLLSDAVKGEDRGK